MHLDSLYGGGGHATGGLVNLGTIQNTHSLVASVDGLPEGASRL